MPTTPVTNALATYGDNRAREELDKRVYLIYAEQTPCFTRFMKEKIGNPNFEWVEESVRAPKSTAVRQAAGFQATAGDPGTRYENSTQIFADDVAVSKTEQEMKKAGKQNALTKQMYLKYAALKRDVDFACISNQGRVKPSSSAAGQTTALVGWLQKGVKPTGATITALVNGSQDDGTPVTLGTSAVLKMSYLNDAEVEIKTDGGKPDMVLAHPKTISNIALFLQSSSSQLQTQQQFNTPRQSKIMVMGHVASIQLPLNAVVELTPEFQWTTTNLDKTFVFILDSSTWKISGYRPWEQERQANDGEALRAHVATELGLKCTSPKANRVVVNVDHDGVPTA